MAKSKPLNQHLTRIVRIPRLGRVLLHDAAVELVINKECRTLEDAHNIVKVSYSGNKAVVTSTNGKRVVITTQH
jgi:hypothetical protein